MIHGKTARETAEINGWRVGTKLYGHKTDVECDRVIRITALGEQSVWGCFVLLDGEPYTNGNTEHNFYFTYREWEVFPPDEALRYASERLEAKAVVDGYVNGTSDGWHNIDNAHNDLLREIIKQLVAHIAGRDLYEGEPRD